MDLLTEDLIEDSSNDNKVNLDYYFQRSRLMTEFSAMHGYTGINKFCAECKRECNYIQVSGVYYECLGANSCGKVICD